jgi:hypothetical protein
VPWVLLFARVFERIIVKRKRFMTIAELLSNSWKSGVVTGGVVAYFGTRVEPFKSHFFLAALAAVGMGALAGIIEIAVRRVAQRPR